MLFQSPQRAQAGVSLGRECISRRLAEIQPQLAFRAKIGRVNAPLREIGRKRIGALDVEQVGLIIPAQHGRPAVILAQGVEEIVDRRPFGSAGKEPVFPGPQRHGVEGVWPAATAPTERELWPLNVRAPLDQPRPSVFGAEHRAHIAAWVFNATHPHDEGRKPFRLAPRLHLPDEAPGARDILNLVSRQVSARISPLGLRQWQVAAFRHGINLARGIVHQRPDSFLKVRDVREHQREIAARTLLH